MKVKDSRTYAIEPSDQVLAIEYTSGKVGLIFGSSDIIFEPGCKDALIALKALVAMMEEDAE